MSKLCEELEHFCLDSPASTFESDILGCSFAAKYLEPQMIQVIFLVLLSEEGHWMCLAGLQPAGPRDLEKTPQTSVGAKLLASLLNSFCSWS